VDKHGKDTGTLKVKSAMIKLKVSLRSMCFEQVELLFLLLMSVMERLLKGWVSLWLGASSRCSGKVSSEGLDMLG